MKNCHLLASFMLCWFHIPYDRAQEQARSAALVIGGYWYYGDGSPIKEHVEIFGCPGAEKDSYELEDFPSAHYLAAGVKLEDQDKVMVCGGYACDETTCSTKENCYVFDPSASANNRWTEGPSMGARRFNFLMATARNMKYPGQGQQPLVLGYGLDTEIYDKAEDKWMAYEQLEDRNWYSLGCLIEYNDKIYSLRDKLVELNTRDWIFSDLISREKMPSQLMRSGKCAGLTIGDHDGIFTQNGFWYDLEAKNWTKKATPPNEPIAGMTNALWSFRGRPTIFGHPVCDNVGNCENKEVVQYNPDTDSWESLGMLSKPRFYHLVVEVPQSFCTALNIATTTTTSDPMTTTTTAGVDTTLVSSALLLTSTVFAYFY